MNTDRRTSPRACGRPGRLQRGQAAALVGLLIFFVVLGVAALAVDVGTNLDNQQQMQGAADAAALAGAQGTGFPGAGVRHTSQELAWADLGLTAPSGSCVAGTSSSGTTCTEGKDGYTVTVTYPYTPFNTTVNDYPATEVVAVDITHLNPTHGFEGFLGIGSTTIHVHAAAVGVAGTRQFPFALGARFLDLTGGGSITAYGSILVDQCSDGGVGDFSSGGGANGGLYENGTTSLLIGGDYTGSNLAYYADAEAVLAADPGSTSCGATANSSASNFTGFSHLVHFSSTYPDYNFAYGFNSGPGVCMVYSKQWFPSTCQSNPEGDARWQDSCWQLPGGKGTTPVGWTNSYAYQSGSGVTVVPATTASVMCGTVLDPTPPEPTGSMEGSYYPYQFPGFPLYQTPEELVQELPPYLEIPNTPGSGITAIPGSGGGSPGYTSTGGNWEFQAGVYVIDGSAALPTIKNNESFSCLSDGGPDEYPNGCVFIFVNGASLNVTGSGSSLDCHYVPGDPSASTYAPCSFFFADGTNPSYSTFSLSSGVNGNLDPIPYTVGSGTAATTTNFPVIYSNGTSTTGPTTSLSKSAVVSLSTPGDFAFNGTIYVPHGIFSSNANADSSSGQVIADSIRLQGGANSSSGVAYNGAAVAPVIGSSHLIE